MKRRWKALAGAALAALVAGAVGGLARASGQPGKTPTEDPVRVLRIYYQAPVLVRTGERVSIPVHVVCVTAHGRACSPTLSLGVRSGAGDVWRFQTFAAGPRLTFDLSAPAERAAASSPDQSVAFFLQAKSGGVMSSLPARDSGRPLMFYVTRDLSPVKVPSLPFGRTRRGRTVLALPWGSGSVRAGLALGRESPTLGPSAFDVDGAGRVHLLDWLQGRVAEFEGDRFVRQRSMHARAGADIAVTGAGTTYVADVLGGRVRVTRFGSSGPTLGHVWLGAGILSQVRAAGPTAYAELLPLDSWVRVPEHSGSEARLAPLTGRPLIGGARLLRVGTERYVWLGIVRGGAVHGAVELLSSDRFGEVEMAEPDGSGGYVVVVRVWRSTPRPTDQFQVIHIWKGRVVETFAVPSRSFADPAPLSRFRLGGDGRLYQLVTSPAGIRIVRFELRGES